LTIFFQNIAPENIHIIEVPSLMRKQSKEDEQTLAELSSAHRRSQAKCQLVQTSNIKRINFFLFAI